MSKRKKLQGAFRSQIQANKVADKQRRLQISAGVQFQRHFGTRTIFYPPGSKSFLSLPRELRDEVYTILLRCRLRPVNLNRFLTPLHGYQAPEMIEAMNDLANLRAAAGPIHREAEEIFFERSTFVLYAVRDLKPLHPDIDVGRIKNLRILRQTGGFDGPPCEEFMIRLKKEAPFYTLEQKYTPPSVENWKPKCRLLTALDTIREVLAMKAAGEGFNPEDLEKFAWLPYWFGL